MIISPCAPQHAHRYSIDTYEIIHFTSRYLIFIVASYCTKMAAVPELLNAGDWQGALSDVDAVLFDCDGD